MIVIVMRLARLLSIAAAALLAASACAQPAAPIIVERDGWKLTANGLRGVLSIEHEALGTVLEEVALKVSAGLRPVSNWTAARNGDVLVIRTAGPRGFWVFEPSRNTLKISATAADAFLAAQAPAADSRVVARLLDPEGTPVTWAGTDEVKGTYGGSETRNPSFLPRRNPECMYFALGPAPGAGFHSSV